ncbi:MAG: hypothetical protein D3908_14145 [Candidatus Electrothrix sp. AUS4]|nr:hypothetical protein [Candidatus Electrothrix sp. AUS4]
MRIAVKVLDASSAEVVDAISGNIAKTEAVKELLATSLTAGALPSDKRRKGSQGKLLQVVEVDGFVFQLMSNKLSNRTITFSFLVTNTGKDRRIRLYGSDQSRLFDYEGNEYGAAKVRFGNSQQNNGWLEKVVISKVPIKSSITFEGVPPEIKEVALLEVSSGSFKAQFRNIPLSK